MSIRTAKLIVLLSLALACHGKKAPAGPTYCNPASPSCRSGQACEALTGDTRSACFPELHVVGSVFDVQTPATKLEGARVAALDANGTPVSDVATTASGGQYDLLVKATREINGRPAAGAAAMLRADKQGYFSFPSGLRPSLPIDLSAAVSRDGKWIVDSAVTNIVDVGLLANASAGPGSVTGTVALPSSGRGVLVVAECGGDAFTAISGRDGSFAIYNLPATTCSVRAYSAGVVYVDGSADLTSSTSVTGLSISIDASGQTGTVSGGLQFVNAAGGAPTSVILVVESTFDATAVRGEAPPGLRAGDLTNNNSSYTISGVPPGSYAVLAAYENDGLVRDPDPAIAGTQIQHITVPTTGGTMSLDSFKITRALDVIQPGASGVETVTTATPVLSWVDDSSECEYHVTVLNGLGTTVWDTTIPGVSGSNPTLTYGSTADTAQALVPGMTYQFRVVSLKDCTTHYPISTTEDLKGVFIYKQ